MTRPPWRPGSWRDFPARQQPAWPDPFALEQTLKTLSGRPPLIFAGEARRLRGAMAEVAAGRAFLLQAGDCAESFADWRADTIRDKLKVILQMALVLTYGAGVPVVKVGRIAGQFAKPRSGMTEMAGGVELPVFRGHIVHDDSPTAEARIPDPERLLAAYNQSASTINLLRAFSTGGFASLSQVHAWNREFVTKSPLGCRYEEVADEISRSMRFMAACGIDLANETALHQVEFWTSHEALLLPWEEALTRRDSLTEGWYDCSAHLLWVGERTRQLDGAHIEFLRGVLNPVEAKLGPTITAASAVQLCEALNPERIPGRLTLVCRMGASRVQAVLPAILSAVRDAGHPVVWACDPMHGNTIVSDSGHKTRTFGDVLAELRGYFAAHAAAGTWPGGVHVELTSDDVNECTGRHHPPELPRYTSICDPRLNVSQSLELAFELVEMLR